MHMRNVIECQNASFHYTVSLHCWFLTGTTADTSGDMSIQVGSLLDDGQWHDVEVKRDEENVILIVDQLNMTNVSTSDFFQLDLDRKVHTACQ